MFVSPPIIPRDNVSTLLPPQLSQIHDTEISHLLPKKTAESIAPKKTKRYVLWMIRKAQRFELTTFN